MTAEEERRVAHPKVDVASLLEHICSQIVLQLQATSCSLSQWDRERNRVVTMVTYAPHPELERPLHIASGDEFALDDYPRTADVLRQGVAAYIRVDDPRADPAERAYLVEADQKCCLMLPLLIEEEAIGIVEIFQRECPHPITDEELSTAWNLAGQAALVIEGGRLFAEARQEARDLTRLLEATTTIPSSLDLDKVLHNAAVQLTRIAGVEGCTLSQHDPDAGTVSTWIEYVGERVPRWQLDQPGTAYLLRDYPLTARVLGERTPAVVQADDPQADPAERALLQKLGMQSLLMLPIVAYGRTVGLLELHTRGYARRFSPHDIALVQVLTNQAAVAIENARLYTQVQEQLGQLQRANEAQTRLLFDLQEMSTPVIPIFEQVLVLPLIGIVDSGRARQFTERLLEAVRQQRARVVLLDITGVPVVDTGVAHALLQAAESARLLGAVVVLVGIRAEVAHTLSTLGVDLSGIMVKANLQTGLEYALGLQGLRVATV